MCAALLWCTFPWSSRILPSRGHRPALGKSELCSFLQVLIFIFSLSIILKFMNNLLGELPMRIFLFSHMHALWYPMKHQRKITSEMWFKSLVIFLWLAIVPFRVHRSRCKTAVLIDIRRICAGLASSQCKLFTNINKNNICFWHETIETFLNCTDCFLNRG